MLTSNLAVLDTMSNTLEDQGAVYSTGTLRKYFPWSIETINALLPLLAFR